MSSYWFQRTVLTALLIVECNSGIFQMKRKVLLFYVRSKLASSEANPLIYATACLKGDIKGEG